MRIQLSDHFTWNRLIRFVSPSIIMMIFTSIYVVVDGFFISNYAGKTAFSAINIVYPFFALLDALAFMMASGGSAIVGKQLGEGNKNANASFSMIVYFMLICAVVIMVPGFICLKSISLYLGASEEMLPHCLLYGRILMCFLPLRMMQYLFQSFFVTAEKSSLGLIVTSTCGMTNMILDYAFVVIFRFGLAGACSATVIAQSIGGLFPLIYFGRENHSILRLVRTSFNRNILIKACTNGLSELVNNFAYSFIFILYNWQLMKWIGENGVAAYGVIQYIVYIFASIFYGYCMGVAPLVSYNYGAKNHKELKNIFNKSILFILCSSIVIVCINELLSAPLSYLFVGYNEELYALTTNALRLYALGFLLNGFNVFVSSFFTALNNGFISGFCSFTNFFVFQVGTIIIMPFIFGLNGIWYAKIVSESLGIIITLFCFIHFKNRYHY